MNCTFSREIIWAELTCCVLGQDALLSECLHYRMLESNLRCPDGQSTGCSNTPSHFMIPKLECISAGAQKQLSFEADS